MEKRDEIRVLYKGLLIGVTEFFRDKKAFDALKEKIIPALFENENPMGTIRVWVAGCSTGEEAFSIAMLLEEYIRQNNLHQDFKIYATDLDDKGIETARGSRFSKQIELQVPECYLTTYFEKKGDYYEINNDLRKKIIFSRHNLLNDPPFIRMDLITCRNLFIYLKEEIQKKIYLLSIIP